MPRSVLISKLRRTTDPRLLLTFDDGPHDPCTDHVLEALDRLGATGLFFVLGNRIDGREDVIKRIVQAGHEIGNHSFAHQAPEGQSLSFLMDDLRRCQARIADVTGQLPRAFRPPMGRMTLPLLVAAKRLGLTPVHWSVEGGEWGHNQGRSVDEIAGHLARSLVPGGIVLLHDDCALVPEILQRPAFVAAIKPYALGATALAAL